MFALTFVFESSRLLLAGLISAFLVSLCYIAFYNLAMNTGDADDPFVDPSVDSSHDGASETDTVHCTRGVTLRLGAEGLIVLGMHSLNLLLRRNR